MQSDKDIQIDHASCRTVQIDAERWECLTPVVCPFANYSNDKKFCNNSSAKLFTGASSLLKIFWSYPVKQYG
jgi:hypothetical protein